MKRHANKLNKARLIRPAAGKRPALHRSFSDGERIARINRWYERQMLSPPVDRVNEFANYGYRGETTRNEGEACENLMEQLLALLFSTSIRGYTRRASSSKRRPVLT